VENEIEQLKILYHEIAKGFSPSPLGFVRHFTEMDNIHILYFRQTLFDKYVKAGVQTTANRLKELIEQGEWSTQEEDQIIQLKYIITDNERMVQTLIAQQQQRIREIIEAKKKELTELLMKKHFMLGLTVEEVTEKDALNYMTYLSFYSDYPSVNKKFSSWDAFEELSEEEIQSHTKVLSEVLNKFTEEKIRQISAMPFFLNPFSYCRDSIYSFLNKPIVELTNQQLLLFSMGSRNLDIQSQSEGQPPDLLGDVNAQQVLNWYDQQYSVILGKRNAQK